MQVVRIRKQIVGIRVPRVESDRGREISFRLGPIVTTSVDVTREYEKCGVIRETGAGNSKLLYAPS